MRPRPKQTEVVYASRAAGGRPDRPSFSIFLEIILDQVFDSQDHMPPPILDGNRG